ncbi:MAG: RdgB/HAM1 family non-canonical purine NTP pyrophosphatase [Candidatus Zixiibacteriota bacterium]|jgi:XTP/dITP diphosphohydrolase
MAMRVVLATENTAKLAEIASILGDPAELIGLSRFPGIVLPPEDGDTYEENALGKARAVARETGVAALADDSGLEVEFLSGRPGVRSSRYAGPDGDARANNEKLLRELKGAPAAGRRARFVCVAALVALDGREWLARGEVEGSIGLEPVGAAGFGYDPLFVPDGHGRTFAEMASAEKNAISQRTRAFSSIKRYLVEI